MWLSYAFYSPPGYLFTYCLSPLLGFGLIVVNIGVKPCPLSRLSFSESGHGDLSK